MYIFILSILAVSFISLCFFKNKFWENRYLVLLITASVTIVVTLSSNYISRNKLGTTTENIFEKKLMNLAYDAKLLDTTTYFITNNKDRKLSSHEYSDKSKKKRASHYLLYYNEGSLKIGYAINGTWDYQYVSKVYIAPSKSEKLAYYSKEKVVYNKRSSKWIANISLPRVETIKCFYLPPSQYNAIPDSLIRKMPI